MARGEIQVPSNPAQSHGNRQDAGGVNASHPAPTPDVESQTLSVVYERVLGRRAEQRCVSYLKFWLSCISERSARGSDATPAPVILVGTHADRIKKVRYFICLLNLIPRVVSF